MRKAVAAVLLAIFTFSSTCLAYDLETLLEAKNRLVEITLKDGTMIKGVVWDVVKIIEDDSNSNKIVRYKISSDDIGKIKISGQEDTSFTRTKYYVVLRKGVVEYQIDSDNISLIGVVKW